MIGTRVKIYGGMTIIDGKATYFADPVEVTTLSDGDLRELAEESRKDRLARVLESKQLQYKSRRKRRVPCLLES